MTFAAVILSVQIQNINNIKMKKLYSSLALIAMVLFSTAAMAQSRCNTDFGNQTPGLSPSDQDSVDCISQGVMYNYEYQFKNLSSFDPGTGPVTIEWIRFDSAVNMPCGITWGTNKASNQFNGGENGCIQFMGTTNDATGQYPIQLWLNAKVSGFPIAIPQPASTIGIIPILRVDDGVTTCPAVDTDTASALNRVSTCNSGESTFTGITNIGFDEISELAIYPNPIEVVGTVAFTSQVAGNFQANVFDMSGRAVQSFPVEVSQGANMFAIDARDLSSGIHLMTITDGNRSISQQFVVSK